MDRIVAAMVAGGYLRDIAKMQKNEELVKIYNEQREKLNDVLNDVARTKRWYK